MEGSCSGKQSACSDDVAWCSFHGTRSHNLFDCRVYKKLVRLEAEQAKTEAGKLSVWCWFHGNRSSHHILDCRIYKKLAALQTRTHREVMAGPNVKQLVSSDELQHPTAERSDNKARCRFHDDCSHDHCRVYKKLVMLQSKMEAKTEVEAGKVLVAKIETQQLLGKLIQWSARGCFNGECSHNHRRIYKKLVKLQTKLAKTEALAGKVLVAKIETHKLLGKLIEWSAGCCFYGKCSHLDSRIYEKRLNQSKMEAGKMPTEAKWSITFDESDCPKNMDLSGCNAVLVEPTIYNYRVSRVLMDGGCGINLLTAKTLDAMQVPRSTMQPAVYKSLRGLVPGAWSTSIGRVTLPVTFGAHENSRTEMVVFEVVNFDIPYKASAILGRSAFAKFMAITHYAYQCMKMPGPNGVITVLSSA